MKLLRWNNAQGPQGKSVEPSASHSGQGLGAKKRFSTSGPGRSFFLTSPLIDQAITRFDLSMSVTAILRQQSFSVTANSIAFIDLLVFQT
jgi:hypothetical protein